MFQTKIVWVEGGHKRVLIWPWIASLRLGQGHIDFFKMDHHIFLIPESNGW